MERAVGIYARLQTNFTFAGDFVSLMGPKIDHVHASYASHWLGRLGTVESQHCRPTLCKLPEPDGNTIAI